MTTAESDPTNLSLRQLFGEEALEVFYWLPAYAFEASPPLPEKYSRLEALKERQGHTYFALFEDDQPAACACFTPLTQNVRGAMFAMGGVYDVVTHPGKRRRGYARQVMQRLMHSMHEQEFPLSCLYPFRESFYQRLGYVTFPQPIKIKFNPLTLQPLLKMDLPGEVQLSQPSEHYQQYLAYLHQVRKHIHGMAMFKFEDTLWFKRDRFWLAQAIVNGETQGVMLYALRGERPVDFTLSALRFYYHTSLGRTLLLDWIARHTDQAVRAEIILPPSERPETWLADMRVERENFWLPGMGRVVDVLGLQGLPCPTGRFTAQLVDPQCPWNCGNWLFESDAGQLTIRPAQQAEFNLTIQALSALVYGSHDPADFALRGWGNPDEEQQTMLRHMFPIQTPYLHEHY